MYHNDNCVAEINMPQEKRIPFNELSKAQTEALCKAEAQVNRILALLDNSAATDNFPMPELPDFKTALQINLELSHRIEDKLDLIRAILEG